jgi:hypothetical protein
MNPSRDSMTPRLHLLMSSLDSMMSSLRPIKGVLDRLNRRRESLTDFGDPMAAALHLESADPDSEMDGDRIEARNHCGDTAVQRIQTAAPRSLSRDGDAECANPARCRVTPAS